MRGNDSLSHFSNSCCEHIFEALTSHPPAAAADRVARLFLVQNTKTGKNIPNYHELYRMSIKYKKRPLNGPSVHKICQHLLISIARPSKIYPNLDIWLENKPSGNPAAAAILTGKKSLACVQTIRIKVKTWDSDSVREHIATSAASKPLIPQPPEKAKQRAWLAVGRPTKILPQSSYF
jgi:hypothetical protein